MERALKYLRLIYEDETVWQKLSNAEADKLDTEYSALKDGITRSGPLIGCKPRQPTHTATTVRVRNGKVSTIDGPFAETKEQLGGYFLIEAKDHNDAIQVASKIPSARLGSIEVRPIWDLKQP